MSHPLDPELFDNSKFEQALAANPTQPIAIFKTALTDANEYLQQRFNEGRSATELVYSRALVVDEILIHAWQRFFTQQDNQIALLAVGGYGRGELHPHSDIDLQILVRKDPQPCHDAIVGFTTFLWDIGLEVGHSVRTLKECVSEAKQDITVATNIQEARLLIGPAIYLTNKKNAPAQQKSGRVKSSLLPS